MAVVLVDIFTPALQNMWIIIPCDKCPHLSVLELVTLSIRFLKVCHSLLLGLAFHRTLRAGTNDLAHSSNKTSARSLYCKQAAEEDLDRSCSL